MLANICKFYHHAKTASILLQKPIT